MNGSFRRIALDTARLQRRSGNRPIQSSVLIAASVTPSSYWLSAALSAEVCFGAKLITCDF